MRYLLIEIEDHDAANPIAAAISKIMDDATVPSPSVDVNRTYSVKEVADALGISNRAVYDRIACGDIQVIPGIGQRKRIPGHELNRLLQ